MDAGKNSEKMSNRVNDLRNFTLRARKVRTVQPRSSRVLMPEAATMVAFKSTWVGLTCCFPV